MRLLSQLASQAQWYARLSSQGRPPLHPAAPYVLHHALQLLQPRGAGSAGPGPGRPGAEPNLLQHFLRSRAHKARRTMLPSAATCRHQPPCQACTLLHATRTRTYWPSLEQCMLCAFWPAAAACSTSPSCRRGAPRRRTPAGPAPAHVGRRPQPAPPMPPPWLVAALGRRWCQTRGRSCRAQAAAASLQQAGKCRDATVMQACRPAEGGPKLGRRDSITPTLQVGMMTGRPACTSAPT